MSRRVLWLAPTIVSTVLLLLFSTGPVAATSGHLFGAIAVEKPTLSYGWADGYGKASSAKHWALKECRKHATNPSDCTVMVTVEDGCAAVAYKNTPTGHKFGTGVAATRKAAEKASLKAVGKGAHGLAWVCSS